MTNAQAVGVGVRLFAIWLFVYAVRSGLVLLVASWRGGDTAGMAAALAAISVMLGIAGALWFFPLSVASRLIPKSALEPRSPVPLDDLQRCGFLLLGLWVLATAVPAFVRYAFAYYLASLHGASGSFGAEFPPAFAGIIAELVLGVWLLFGAKGLLGLLHWARTAGH